MGIITNGFLVGSKKSAGGINFLRIKGQQVFRNKPQVSANYVPSHAQILQRSLQSSLTKAIKNNEQLQNLINYGWDRHIIKRTNSNEFQRDALRLFTRNADSSLSLIGDKEDRMAIADSIGYDKYILDRMAAGDIAFTKSKFEFPSEAVYTSGGTAAFLGANVEAIKQMLGNKYSQDYVNSEPFVFVVLESSGTISVMPAPYTPTSAVDVVKVAVAAPAVQNGNIVVWLYSSSVELDFDQVNIPVPTVTDVKLDGSSVFSQKPFTWSSGESVTLTGANIADGDIRMYNSSTSSWLTTPTEITIGSRSATTAALTRASGPVNYEISSIEIGNVVVW